MWLNVISEFAASSTGARCDAGFRQGCTCCIRIWVKLLKLAFRSHVNFFFHVRDDHTRFVDKIRLGGETTKRLVIGHLERVSGDVLDQYPSVIKDLIKGKSGVYALYCNDSLYYVGLAKNLIGRLKAHTKDRHQRFILQLSSGRT
ncbi:MAG: GIY-YIG nuclease family protein, partial [Proteobacteria bacterium]|nr:GIY-YIG nuclease family protein [Pseudomonadota bacterium]